MSRRLRLGGCHGIPSFVERTLGRLLSYDRLALRSDRTAPTITTPARLAITRIRARRLGTNQCNDFSLRPGRS